MNIVQMIQYSPVASTIFLFTVASSLIAMQRGEESRRLMLHPYSLVRQKKYMQLLTSGFIHADWMHLGFNMLTFYFFALSTGNIKYGVYPIEYVMTELSGPIGHLYFLLVYLLSMVLGDVTTIWKQKDNKDYYALGASGAVSGLVFAYMLFYPDARLGFFFLPAMPAPLFAVVFIIISILSSRSRYNRINHEAHIWGGLVGFALCALLYPDAFLDFIDAVKALLNFS